MPGTAEHYPFALKLYLTTMRPYTEELMAWDEAKQSASFARQWEPKDVTIITFQQETIGWLQVAVTPWEIWLQQMFISPEYQGRGIGTAVLTRLLIDWNSRGVPVKLSVLRNNPARRFYERCGFAVVAEVGVKLEMRLSADRPEE